ncbi:hypothetical protein Ah1_00030 [Aeromonas phage Ah1]|uniref:Uncharacterized protein n=1 Tax=Aeromonas phage Ah1 TaxID=2053701 RepID=A0A2H4YEH4_9CAUD|nr:hypothetical protein KNT77_gp030 [Aeromonas phage Ah1]AUE22571.1 hypothetical protein Ah1_00030 [Aeromonas phage Ah1]
MTETQLESVIAEDQREIEEAKEREQAAIKSMVEKKSKKYLAKNRKEIERLRLHAEECLHVCNKDGYIYAIEKLRVLTLQKPIARDVLESLWMSSKQRYDELVMEAYQKVKESKPEAASETEKVSLTPVCSV